MLKLLGNRIAILPIEDADVYKGLIFVPDQGKQKVDHGIVAYRGPKVEALRVGDHVAFSAYSGIKATIETEGVFIIMREPDVSFYLDGPPHPILPLAEINRMIEQAKGAANPFETLHSLINDYVIALGLEF